MLFSYTIVHAKSMRILQIFDLLQYYYCFILFIKFKIAKLGVFFVQFNNSANNK